VDPSVIGLFDKSLAVGIAAAAGYFMFRLYEKTETARREFMATVVTKAFEDIKVRLMAIEAKLEKVRGM
jgi:hypothetical protein